MKKISIMSGLWLLMVLTAFALPIDLKQGDTLIGTSGGETVFEVEPLSTQDLARLKSWLAKPGGKVKVSASGAKIVGAPVSLKVGNRIARFWKSDSKSLAKMFAQRLDRIVGTGSPSWGRAGQVVPLSESREVALRYYPRGGELSAEVEDPSIATVENLGGGRFKVAGVGRGRTRLVVSGAGVTIPALPIQVKPWAARWGKGPERIEFFGAAGPKRIRQTLTRWLSARTLLGANTVLKAAESEDDTLKFVARASAPGALPVETSMTIKPVIHPAQRLNPAASLLLSNHPEKVFEEGVLYQRQAPGPSFRTMWHHRNDPEGPDRYLILQLKNPTPSPRRLRILWSSYGPSPDEIHVGHTAAFEYIMAARDGLSERMVLPPNGLRTVEIRMVKAGQTMSGVAYVEDESGSDAPLEFRVVAADGNGPIPTAEAVSRDPGRTASGLFPGEVRTDETHLLGGPFTFIEYGGEPYVQDIEKGGPSYGNFGTVYRTRLVLKNTTDEERTATLGFASAGGAARGVLRVDEVIYDLPMGRTGNGIDVCTYQVPAQQEIQVDLELFPQAGSNYPIRVVVRSDYQRFEKLEVTPKYPLEPMVP